MTTTPVHPFGSSKDSLSLRDLVGELADKWLVGTTCCTDVDALFGCVTSIFHKSLSAVARNWNLEHDRLRKLPPELRDACMLSLPTIDKCKLGSVSSLWRENISTRPSLWSDIDMVHNPGALAAILSRSGQSALRVSLTVSSRNDWDSANEILRTHSHRLEQLHVRFDAWNLFSFSTPWSLLNYSAPSLREITLDWISPFYKPRAYSIPPDFCTGTATRLRCITLRHVGLPPACRALSCVSDAWIEGEHTNGVEHVFTVLPSLRRLHLIDLPSETRLPVVPRNHPIADVRFHNFEPPAELLQPEFLRKKGYLRLHKLAVVSQAGLAHLAAASRALSASLHSFLAVKASGATELILRNDGGCEAIFEADALYLPEIRDALRDGIFRDVAQLVLPLHPDARRTGRCPLLQGAIDLPRLLSLQIRCGRPRGSSLLDPAAQRGIIRAPLLTRLEIAADAHPQQSEICASHLAHFVETTLELGDASALELVIDTAHGMLLESASDLEDQMAYLRSCVGALHM